MNPLSNYTPIPANILKDATKQYLSPRKKIFILTLIVIVTGGLLTGIFVLKKNLSYTTPAKTQDDYEREKACANIPECLNEFKPPCPIHPDCTDDKPGCTSPPEGYCKIKTPNYCFECYTQDRGIRMICMCPAPTTPTSAPTTPTSAPTTFPTIIPPTKIPYPSNTPIPTIIIPSNTLSPSICPLPKNVENIKIICPICR